MNKDRLAATRILLGAVVVLAVVVVIVAVVKLDIRGQRGRSDVLDVERLARIDPNLILYEESGSPISTGFAVSRAVAVDSNDNIYVAGDEAIHIFDAGGNEAGKIDLHAGPSCLAISAEKSLYVGLEDHVEVYDLSGQRLAAWPSPGQRAVLTSIAVSKEGVFVADAGDRVVLHYDSSGKLLNTIGRKDPQRNIPGFVVPSAYFDLIAPRAGLLRVVNPGLRRIEAYTIDGELEFWWGKTSVSVEGFCGCCNPVNIAVLPDGGFVTSEKGLTRVKVYDSQGVFKGVVAGPEQLVGAGSAVVCEFPEQCQSSGFDVAVDSAGRVIVLDTLKNRVRIFTRKETG